LTTTGVRRISIPSWIRKMLRIFEKTTFDESSSTQAIESIHASVHADYWKSINKARLEAERMKAEGYAVFERQRLRWL